MNTPQLCKSAKKTSRKVHVEEKSGTAFKAFTKSGSVCGTGKNCRPQITPSNSCNHIHTKQVLGPFKAKRTFNFLGLGVLRTSNFLNEWELYHSGDTFALQTWLNKKWEDKFTCTLITIMITAFTARAISLKCVYSTCGNSTHHIAGSS